MLRVVSLMASATEILLPGSSRLGSSQVIILGRHHRSSRGLWAETFGREIPLIWPLIPSHSRWVQSLRFLD